LICRDRILINQSEILVVGIGELLWDLLPTGKQLGGAPANFAYHTQVLGARSFIVSAIGDDPLGHELVSQLKDIGLTNDFIVTDLQHPTGTVTVKLDAKGVPDFIIHPGVAWDFIPQSRGLEALAGIADVVCYGTLAQRMPVSHQTIQAFLRSTLPRCLRIFDVNLRQCFFNRDIIEETLRLSTVLKLNDGELPVLAGLLSLNGSESEILQQLVETYRLQLIALTKGEAGSVLISAQETSKLSAPSVDVVDTVGAGDAFTAALATGLLAGLPLRKIHEQATRLAAYVCTQKGATPSISREKCKEILL
jgi:fructokinase